MRFSKSLAVAGIVAGAALAAGSAAASAPPSSDGAAAIEGALDCSTVLPEGNGISTFIGATDFDGPQLNEIDPPFTVLVPADSAFEAIPTNVLDAILGDEALLTSIIDYHVIAGQALTVADLAEAGEVDSAIGAPLTFELDGDALLVNGGEATVVCADLEVEDGAMIQVIDSVLQPPAGAEGGPGSSVPGSSVPGSSVPGSSVPGDSVPGVSGPGDSVAAGAGFDADQQAVATAWETAVNSSLSFEDVAPVIEDADALQATIEAYPAAADMVGGITATVTQVTIDGDAAQILYTVSFDGVEAPYGELEGALVKVDGSWLVPHDEYCAVQAYARNDC
jgi:hypothetical protein